MASPKTGVRPVVLTLVKETTRVADGFAYGEVKPALNLLLNDPPKLLCR